VYRNPPVLLICSPRLEWGRKRTVWFWGSPSG